MFQVSFSFHSSMSQFCTHSLLAISLSIYLHKKSAKCHWNNHSSQELNSRDVRLIIAGTLWKLKVLLCFCSKILDSRNNIKCSVKPECFEKSFHLRLHLKNRRCLKQQWEPVSGGLHAATVRPLSIERLEQFVSLKHAGWCLLLVELYVCCYIDFLI